MRGVLPGSADELLALAAAILALGIAQRALDERVPLRELLAADPAGAALDLDAIFDYAPFVRYADRGVLVLVKTSNPGSKDFQELELASGEPLYMAVAEAVARLGPNVGFVIGATYPEQLRALRARFPLTSRA